VLIALAPGEPGATARVAEALRSAGLAVAIGAVAESAGLSVVNASVADTERVRLHDGRVVAPAQLARELEAAR